MDCLGSDGLVMLEFFRVKEVTEHNLGPVAVGSEDLGARPAPLICCNMLLEHLEIVTNELFEVVVMVMTIVVDVGEECCSAAAGSFEITCPESRLNLAYVSSGVESLNICYFVVENGHQTFLVPLEMRRL